MPKAPLVGPLALAAALAVSGGYRPAAAAPRTPTASSAARLDEYLTRLSEFGFSGAALVARDEEVLLQKGYGLAYDRARRAVTPATAFDVCSFTKQFTAAAILKLEEQGKLRTEDLLSKHLSGVPPDKAAITLHHLLTHTAGLDDPPGEDYERAERDDYAGQVLAAPLLWAPGTRYAYSNGGYSLLGAVVERLSGQSWEDYLDLSFFRPRGMLKTGYRRSRWSPDEMAHGYHDGTEFGSPLDHPGPYEGVSGRGWPGPYWFLAANGGVLSTVGDLFRWSRALDGSGALGPDTRRKLFQPYVLAGEWGNETRYAYGWNVTRTPRGTTSIHHTGSSGSGFNAWVHRYQDERATVVLLSNRIVDGVRLTRGIYEAVDRILFGTEPAWPPAAKGTLAPEAARRLEGVYRLPSGETFFVATSGAGLEITGRGSRAITALAFGGQGEAESFRSQEGRLLEILRGIERGDYGPYAKALWTERRIEEEQERLRPFWDRLSRARGRLRSCRVLGSGPHEFLRQVYLDLAFERGADLRLVVEANAEGQLAIRTDPASSQVPDTFLFLPQSEREFASFNLRLASGTTVTFDLDGSGHARALRVSTAQGELQARRER